MSFENNSEQAGDTAHFVHVDGNLKVHDSAPGTVFMNFMIQGVLNVSGHNLPDPDRATPAVAAATIVGLTDHDLNVNDDQSFVATDYYSEQIKTVHATLTGTGAHTGYDCFVAPMMPALSVCTPFGHDGNRVVATPCVSLCGDGGRARRWRHRIRSPRRCLWPSNVDGGANPASVRSTSMSPYML